MGQKKASTAGADLTQEPAADPTPPPPTAAQVREDEARAVGKRPIEEWAEVKGIGPGAAGYWKYTSTVRLMGWTERHLVTEGEFDEAMTKFHAQVIR